jgi:uncharacterized cupredoxin-like copper-binding protein
MTTLRRLVAVLSLPALVLLAACGSSDEEAPLASAGEDRTVEITMRDIAFSPDRVDVRAGEKIRFVFTNTGSLTHDAFIGDAAAQEKHEKDMRSGHDHGEGTNAITLRPGKQGQLVHTFERPGQVIIGCHEPGHYTGGMKVTVNVA